MSKKLFQELVDQAHLEYDSNNLDAALEHLLEAEKIKKNVDLMIDIALIYDELNKYDLAKRYYENALELDVNNARAYYGLGTVYDNLAQYDEAIAFYHEAIRIDEHFFPAHFFLANIYDERREINLAIYHYEKVIEENPDYFYAYLNLGAIYESLDEDKKALEYLNKAKAINEDNHLLYFNLGVVHRKMHLIKESIEFYKKSLTISTSHPYTFLNLAIIFKDDCRDLSKAIEIYTMGISNHPKEAVLYYNRACAYAIIGRVNEAINDLVTAIALDPLLREYMEIDEELYKLRRTTIYRKTFVNN